jgi:hypothetical protein
MEVYVPPFVLPCLQELEFTLKTAIRALRHLPTFCDLKGTVLLKAYSP